MRTTTYSGSLLLACLVMRVRVSSDRRMLKLMSAPGNRCPPALFTAMLVNMTRHMLNAPLKLLGLGNREGVTVVAAEDLLRVADARPIARSARRLRLPAHAAIAFLW